MMLLQRRGALEWWLPRFDVNVFLERFHPSWFPFARHNVLIPNPEWFMEEQMAHLPGIDVVFCKTHHAVDAFSALGVRTLWVGFTSEDKFNGELAARQPLRALHIAGRSIEKGTAGVVELWRRHSEWPALTVVQRPHVGALALDTTPAPNIRFLTHRLEDAEIRSLQCEHSVHVLPSEAEGYGQAIVEGMSAGALVVTSDAPPMNELIQADRGLLVRGSFGRQMRMVRRIHVDAVALEDAITQLLASTDEARTAMGMAAREWFTCNDKLFRVGFADAIRALDSKAS